MAETPAGGDIVKVRSVCAANFEDEEETCKAEEEQRKWQTVTCQESSQVQTLDVKKKVLTALVAHFQKRDKDTRLR